MDSRLFVAWARWGLAGCWKGRWGPLATDQPGERACVLRLGLSPRPPPHGGFAWAAHCGKRLPKTKSGEKRNWFLGAAARREETGRRCCGDVLGHPCRSGHVLDGPTCWCLLLGGKVKGCWGDWACEPLGGVCVYGGVMCLWEGGQHVHYSKKMYVPLTMLP